MNIRTVFDTISTDECLGYKPVSSSTKPAHIANGWFRRLAGKVYDPVLLNEVMIHWVRSRELNPSEPLLDRESELFQPFLPQTQRQAFVDFRADLRALLSPYGGAVNSGNDWSSYNITTLRHLTKDRADNSVGAFLYHLLTTDCGSGPSPLVGFLLNILKDTSDELSTLTTPLLKEISESAINVGTYPAVSVFKKGKDGFSSQSLRHLREGFDHLYQFEASFGGGLDALRRAVAFGVFAVLVHMVNRGPELRRAKGITPMLLYFGGRRRNTVHYASHQTYSLCRQSIEQMYTSKFQQKVAARIGSAPSFKECQNFVKQLEFEKPNETESKRLEISNLLSAYTETQEPIEALASALTDVTFRLMSGDPTDFYRGLGVRVGFLRPTGGTRKFFSLDGILLEAVLASCVSAEALTYKEFLDILYERYGILTGGRQQDADVLLGVGIDQVTVEDLRENSMSLRKQLVATGWASEYADGVMNVHLPHGGQS
jgi:hypothetical protein